ncbi:MAG TPA: tetratricopeptide repeat protein [Candidatus Saccharimonadales bacterium]|jgi:predicted ATPase/class 3 adenylate cyclase|nr:tetratricopeptide repeat protein [Candidatus Saccharimonadales bacterium]
MTDRALPTGTLTFFFSDIEGSTRLVQQLSAGFRPVLEEHDRLMRTAIQAGGGVEVRTVGDAFFVVFPTAAGAVRGAVAAQRALGAATWPDGVTVRVRVGLHTGVGELGGGDYVGLDVHIAARITAAAHGGQIVVSNATRSLLPDGSGLALRDLGEHRLKDVGSVRLWQVSAEGLASEFPPLASLDPVVSLPAAVTAFVGREREVSEVRALVREHRLVTLTGPAGTGKTRLSVEAAAGLDVDARDGVFFVPLATVTDPALIPAAIATAIALPEDPARSALDAVTAHLRERSALLVLDNFEQLVPGAAVVSTLQAAAPKLRCLVSSRETLHLYGEQEYPVPVLSSDDAIALFAQRARAARPGFTITPANEAAVRAICERVDRLPLAIELAAARMKLFDPPTILARLDKSLELLTTGARDRPERQRTLRGAIAWSHDLLTEPEQRLFRRLAVFVGPIPLKIVPLVADEHGDLGLDPIEGVANLVDKSLLTRLEVLGELRVAMLETIRAFGLEALERSGEAEAIRARHASCVVHYAERLEPDLLGDRAAATLDELEVAHDNVRAALGYALAHDLDSGLRLAAAVWRFWQQRAHLREGRDWLDRLLAAEPGSALARGRALTALGGIAWWQADLGAAGAAYEESLRVFESIGDQSNIADALYNLGAIDLVAGRIPASREKLERALATYRKLDDATGIVKTGGGLVALLYKLSDYATALPLQDEVVSRFRALGSHYHVGDALGLETAIAIGAGDLAKARGCLDQAIEIMTELDDRSGLVGVLVMAALLATAQGDGRRAARLYGGALKMRADFSVVAAPLEILGVPNPGERAKALLGQEAYDAAYREGTALAFDALVAEARRPG